HKEGVRRCQLSFAGQGFPPPPPKIFPQTLFALSLSCALLSSLSRSCSRSLALTYLSRCPLARHLSTMSAIRRGISALIEHGSGGASLTTCFRIFLASLPPNGGWPVSRK